MELKFGLTLSAESQEMENRLRPLSSYSPQDIVDKLPFYTYLKALEKGWGWDNT